MKLATLFGAAALSLSAAAMADDRPVTDEERAQIEAVLETEGFTRWDGMEFDIDDNCFEVDDAIHEDGREYDLKLDADFVIISRELED